MPLTGCLMAHGSHLGDIISVGDFKRASSFILPENYWKESETDKMKSQVTLGKFQGKEIKNPKRHFAKCSSEIQILSDLPHPSAW